MYLYSYEIFKIIKKIKPSIRGELEITDVNNFLLKENAIKIVKLGRGIVWYDAGTYDDLLKVSNLLESIEKRQGKMIGCLEEIALQNKWLSKNQLKKNNISENNLYSKYLKSLV